MTGYIIISLNWWGDYIMDVEILLFVFLLGVIILPPMLMLGVDCFKMTLDSVDELRVSIRKFREKNYCRKCGVIIPRGEKYCRKCVFERWADEREY